MFVAFTSFADEENCQTNYGSLKKKNQYNQSYIYYINQKYNPIFFLLKDDCIYLVTANHVGIFLPLDAKKKRFVLHRS